jgi:hypothetical protein
MDKLFGALEQEPGAADRLYIRQLIGIDLARFEQGLLGVHRAEEAAKDAAKLLRQIADALEQSAESGQIKELSQKRHLELAKEALERLRERTDLHERRGLQGWSPEQDIKNMADHLTTAGATLAEVGSGETEIRDLCQKYEIPPELAQEKGFIS